MSEKEKLEKEIKKLEKADEPKKTTRKKPAKKIEVEHIADEDEVEVKVEQDYDCEDIIIVLRELTDDDFKLVVRAAKQYRRADRILAKFN